MRRWWEHGYVQGVSRMCCIQVRICNFTERFHQYFILMLVAKFYTGLRTWMDFFNDAIEVAPFGEILVGQVKLECCLFINFKMKSSGCSRFVSFF
jgi:hypothetical protein